MEEQQSHSAGNALVQSMQNLSLSAQRQTRRELEQVQSQVLVTRVQEEGRAHLAYAALEHVGALTSMEQHLLQVAPGGAARYREIIDSYAIGAAVTIQRWGR